MTDDSRQVKISGKWIDGLRPDMATVDAARLVLETRLGGVRLCLTPACQMSNADIEFVHQLRVATRRAAAALRIFRDSFAPRDRKKIRRRLRDLRQAAGAARDWDVFLQNLSPRLAKKDSQQRLGFVFLNGVAQGERMAAQEQLARAIQSLDMDALISQTMNSLKDDHDATLRDLAEPALAGLLGDWTQAASGDLRDYDHLHKVRIAGKHLRYAMEVFECCFGEAFRDKLYPAVEDMQDILGKANDSHVASQRLQAIRDRLTATQPTLWPNYRPGIESLMRAHQRRLPAQRRLFLKWRENWQNSGTESLFQHLEK